MGTGGTLVTSTRCCPELLASACHSTCEKWGLGSVVEKGLVPALRFLRGCKNKGVAVWGTYRAGAGLCGR